MSTPHFLDGAPEYAKAFGLKPDKKLHRTNIDLEKVNIFYLTRKNSIKVFRVLIFENYFSENWSGLICREKNSNQY